jgi:hypothetical protein
VFGSASGPSSKQNLFGEAQALARSHDDAQLGRLVHH